MRTLQAIRLALCLCLAPSSLRAAPYDGSVPLLCAAMTGARVGAYGGVSASHGGPCGAPGLYHH